jgi:hypothetical protein
MKRWRKRHNPTNAQVAREMNEGLILPENIAGKMTVTS